MSDKLNIEIGEVEETKIDYSKTTNDLISYFDEQSERIDRGERGADIELMMLGYAIDFLVFAKKATNIVLDFEEEVIPTFDEILEALHKHFKENTPTREQFEDTIKQATGFLCVVIWKNIGGGFFNSNIGIGINIKGNNAFVMNRIGRRLQNGKEDDIVTFYDYLKKI